MFIIISQDKIITIRNQDNLIKFLEGQIIILERQRDQVDLVLIKAVINHSKILMYGTHLHLWTKNQTNKPRERLEMYHKIIMEKLNQICQVTKKVLTQMVKKVFFMRDIPMEMGLIQI